MAAQREDLAAAGHGSTRTASTASGAEARRVARWSCFLVLDLAFNRFVDLSLIFFGGII